VIWFPIVCLAAWALVLRVCCQALANTFLRLLNHCTGDAQ
jgi:hypothetical protein